MPAPTTVIYNGECPICSREVAGYRRHAEARALPIRFDPLASADLARWGLTADQAARRFHVIQDGRLIAGVDAFIALWMAMPRFRPLARVVSLPGIRQIAGLAYEYAAAPALYALHRRRLRRHSAA